MKYLMTILAMMFFISCATPGKPGKAVDAEPEGSIDAETIHAYLLATQAESNINKIRKIMLLQMQTSFERMVRENINQNPVLDQADQAGAALLLDQAINGFVTRLDESLKKIMPFNEIETRIYTPVIGKHFTKKELDALTQFYGSPVGKKYIEAVPLLMQDINQMVNQVYGRKIQETVQTIGMEEFDKISSQMELLRKK